MSSKKSPKPLKRIFCIECHKNKYTVEAGKTSNDQFSITEKENKMF
jgi:hypothetical protein